MNMGTRLFHLSYWGVCREYGRNMVDRDYVRNIFPYSILRNSKSFQALIQTRTSVSQKQFEAPWLLHTRITNILTLRSLPAGCSHPEPDGMYNRGRSSQLCMLRT